MSMDINVLIRHMQFQGFVFTDGKFYKPYSGISMNLDEARKWLDTLLVA